MADNYDDDGDFNSDEVQRIAKGAVEGIMKQEGVTF